MQLRTSDQRWITIIVCTIALSSLTILAVVFRGQWLPWTTEWVASAQSTSNQQDDHTHILPVYGLDQTNSLELSPEAQKNIGLTTVLVNVQPFVRTISMPAIVVERPGRSQLVVTAPLGGRVTLVYPIQGEAVMPGQPLFDLRLTHEELVNSQSELLRAAEELDVVRREIERLSSVTVSGAIPGKTMREREYEQQKLEAVLNAQRQSLVLHGLTPEQVESIVKTRKLLQGITVETPPFPPNGHDEDPDHPFHIHQLNVKPGQYVHAGDSLCVLADHHELFIEGRAFEQDAERLNRTTNEGWSVTAMTMLEDKERERIDGLKVFYLSDVVDTESRAFHFYLRLPNRMVRDVVDASGHRFVTWKFKPGQRMQVSVPVQRWDNRIVLPVEAVAQEGAETFVFEQNGNYFDRVPVHVEYRDKDWVVIENDGHLIGGRVAASGAHQLQMALKKKAGGGDALHAGHHH